MLEYILHFIFNRAHTPYIPNCTTYNLIYRRPKRKQCKLCRLVCAPLRWMLKHWHRCVSYFTLLTIVILGIWRCGNQYHVEISLLFETRRRKSCCGTVKVARPNGKMKKQNIFTCSFVGHSSNERHSSFTAYRRYTFESIKEMLSFVRSGGLINKIYHFMEIN